MVLSSRQLGITLAASALVISVSPVAFDDDSNFRVLQGTQRTHGGALGWMVFALSCLGLFRVGRRKIPQTTDSGISFRATSSYLSYPQIDIGDKPARLLNTPALFIAQVGFLQPELVVSQGLLQTLARSHLKAVLVHEQGHYHYRDTFSFFWLGWLRFYTAWLPNTEALWEKLLALRELRADRWAATQVDSLLLAESLLLVGSEQPLVLVEIVCAAFGAVTPRNSLEERIEALLAEPEEIHQPNLWSWRWLLLAFLPLLAVPFHT